LPQLFLTIQNLGAASQLDAPVGSGQICESSGQQAYASHVCSNRLRLLQQHVVEVGQENFPGWEASQSTSAGAALAVDWFLGQGLFWQMEVYLQQHAV
jgi:hypothetical protein